MPDLGDYAGAVLSAYAISLVLLALIIGISWRRAIAVQRALEKAERDG